MQHKSVRMGKPRRSRGRSSTLAKIQARTTLEGCRRPAQKGDCQRSDDANEPFLQTELCALVRSGKRRRPCTTFSRTFMLCESDAARRTA
jgi:hypothetical protein